MRSDESDRMLTRHLPAIPCRLTEHRSIIRRQSRVADANQVRTSKLMLDATSLGGPFG